MPERVLGRPATMSTSRNAATGPIAAHRVDEFVSQGVRVDLDAGFQHDQPAGL